MPASVQLSVCHLPHLFILQLSQAEGSIKAREREVERLQKALDGRQAAEAGLSVKQAATEETARKLDMDAGQV